MRRNITLLQRPQKTQTQEKPQYIEIERLEGKIIKVKREKKDEKFHYSFVEFDKEMDAENSSLNPGPSTQNTVVERPMTLTLSKSDLDPLLKNNLLRRVQELFFAPDQESFFLQDEELLLPQDSGENATGENKAKIFEYLKLLYGYNNQQSSDATYLAQSNQGFGVVVLGEVSEYKIDADLPQNNPNKRRVLAIFDQTKEVEETKLPNAIFGGFTAAGTAALNLFRAEKKPIQPPFIKYVGQDGSYSYNTYAEVFADEVPELRRQNREIIQLGDKKYLKISREFQANVVGTAQSQGGKINSIDNLHKIFGETYERMTPSQFRINRRTQEEFKSRFVSGDFTLTGEFALISGEDSQNKFFVKYETITSQRVDKLELDEQGNVKIYRQDRTEVDVNSLDYAVAMNEMRQRIIEKGQTITNAESKSFENEFKTENFVPLSAHYAKDLKPLILEGDLERKVNPAPIILPRATRNLQKPAQFIARTASNADEPDILKHIFVVSAKAAGIDNTEDLKRYCGFVFNKKGTNNISLNEWRDSGFDKKKGRDFSHIFQHLTKEFGIVDNSANQVGKRLFNFIENIEEGTAAIDLYSQQTSQKFGQSSSMQALVAKHQEIHKGQPNLGSTAKDIITQTIQRAIDRKVNNSNRAANPYQGR